MNAPEIEWLMFPMSPEMTALLKRPAWQSDAACRGLEVDTFFPGSHEDLGASVATCVSCPVKNECLNYALEDPSLKGVWGGTSARQRSRLRRQAS
jgi:WhiB family redox-sensing transcriptional regulator